MYIPKHFTLPPLTKTKAYNSNKYLTVINFIKFCFN
jgi:hypothetical protein